MTNKVEPVQITEDYGVIKPAPYDSRVNKRVLTRCGIIFI